VIARLPLRHTNRQASGAQSRVRDRMPHDGEGLQSAG
jgi:hypothetical protein